MLVFLGEIACQTWEACFAFVTFFPLFNLNAMLIPPAALFQMDLLRAVNLRCVQCMPVQEKQVVNLS